MTGGNVSGGGGNGSGQVTGGSGSGSIGRGGFSDNDPIENPVRGEIVDPVAVQSSEEVRVDLNGNLLGDTVGTAGGVGLPNLPTVPYQNLFTEYEQAALESLDSLSVPPALREIVSNYFTELEP